MKLENTEVWGFEHAIRGMRKGYRKTKNGKYETFVNSNGKTISLGTYDTEEKAQQRVFHFYKDRIETETDKVGLRDIYCKIYKNKYLVFENGVIFNLCSKELKGIIDNSGYREVTIDNKQKLVHRIVAERFIPNPENKPCVNHKDGNKLNNDISNLEWCTYSENTKHAYENGLEKKCLGEEHHAHKLTEENVIFIREHYKPRDKQYSAVKLGKMFGVTEYAIKDVIRRKSWRWL